MTSQSKEWLEVPIAIKPEKDLKEKPVTQKRT